MGLDLGATGFAMLRSGTGKARGTRAMVHRESPHRAIFPEFLPDFGPDSN
jgi:hypothetical protein